MEIIHLFAGIYIDNTQAYATVMDQKGKALLCNQYGYDHPQDAFPEIVAHLRNFADFYDASLHIALADRWGNSAPIDADSLLFENVLLLSHQELSQANLPHNSYGPNSQYDKPKLLALLGALRYAAN